MEKPSTAPTKPRLPPEYAGQTWRSPAGYDSATRPSIGAAGGGGGGTGGGGGITTGGGDGGDGGGAGRGLAFSQGSSPAPMPSGRTSTATISCTSGPARTWVT